MMGHRFNESVATIRGTDFVPRCSVSALVRLVKNWSETAAELQLTSAEGTVVHSCRIGCYFQEQGASKKRKASSGDSPAGSEPSPKKPESVKAE
eukprot:3791677-Amphidinium_carterae.4